MSRGELINMTRTLNKDKIWSESPTGIGPMTSQRSRGHGFNPRHVLRFCLCSTLVSCWSIFTFHKTVLTARKLKARGMRKEIFLLHMPLVFHSPFLLYLFHIFHWLEEIAVLWREKKKFIPSVKQACAKARIKLSFHAIGVRGLWSHKDLLGRSFYSTKNKYLSYNCVLFTFRILHCWRAFFP